MSASEIIRTTFNVSAGNLTNKYVINVEYDFSGVDRAELINWALYDRNVAMQRVLRATDDAYVRELAAKTVKIHARSAGCKIMTLDQQIDQLVKTIPGLSRENARKLITNPTILDERGSK